MKAAIIVFIIGTIIGFIGLGKMIFNLVRKEPLLYPMLIASGGAIIIFLSALLI